MNNRLTFQQSNYNQPTYNQPNLQFSNRQPTYNQQNLQFSNIQHNYAQPNYNRTIIPNPRIQTATYNVNTNNYQTQYRQNNVQPQYNIQSQQNNLRFNNGQPRGCGCGGAI